MIPATVIFSYGPDGPCLVECVGALVDAGLTTIRVYDDAGNPISAEVESSISELGAVVQKTAFLRGGNLKGPGCVEGIADCYIDALSSTGASHVLKLDCDTVVARTGMILRAVGDGVAAAGQRIDGFSELFGMAEILSAETCAEIKASAALCKPGQGEDDFSATVANRMSGEFRRWDYDPMGGYAAGWQYHKAMVSLEEYANRFDVVTFGNRYLLGGCHSDVVEQVALTMAAFRRILTLRNNQTPNHP